MGLPFNWVKVRRRDLDFLNFISPLHGSGGLISDVVVGVLIRSLIVRMFLMKKRFYFGIARGRVPIGDGFCLGMSIFSD